MPGTSGIKRVSTPYDSPVVKLRAIFTIRLSNLKWRCLGPMSERKIFVVGHKNPDTDPIVSAVAYAG